MAEKKAAIRYREEPNQLEKRRDRMKCIRVNTYAFLKKHEPRSPDAHHWHFFIFEGMPPIK